MKVLTVTAALVLIFSAMIFPAMAEEAEAPPEEEAASPSPASDGYLTVEPDEVPSDGFTDLRKAIVSIFGKYTPRTQTVTRHLDDGTEVTYTEYVPGIAGMDFEWIFSATVFALVVFCVFKLIGGIFKL